jgi:BirA family biotin operon repressor/biotin-[acetyl-CoA-carboxylase] ligase
VYLSAVWEFTGGAAALEGLSLAVGVVVVEALAQLGVGSVQLKWPNDVLSDGHKLAGILIEMVGDASGLCQVVVGIGINVAIPPAIGNEIDQPWIDVNTIAGKKISRNALVSHLLNRLLPMLARFESDGFPAYWQRWSELDAFQGQQVVVRLGLDTVTGIAAGVDTTGSLLLDTALGRRHFNGGEVSLRRADDSGI